MSKSKKIDEVVNNAFENFEMPYDATQWDLLQKKMDQMNAGNSFDNTVKNKLENHEVAYQPAAWSAVESQLAASSVSYTKWIVAAGVIGLISIGGYFILNNNETPKVKAEVKTEKNLANNKVEINNVVESTSNNNIEEPVSNNANNNIIDEPVNSNHVQAINNVVNNVNTNNSTNTNTNTISINNNNTSNNNTNINVNPIDVNPVSSGTSVWQFANPEIKGVTEICSSEKVQFVSSETESNVSITWKLNGVEVGSERELNLVNLTVGNHEIELIHTATKNIENCSSPVLISKTYLNVKETPKVDFTYKQIGDAYYPETKFETLSESNFDDLTWTLDGKSFSSEEVIYIFNKKGNYPVTVEATFENGCKFTESKNIEINNDYNLLAPIAFTPNADGINDVFIPEALKVLNLPFKMTIYDRNQGYVYQTSRVDAPWNGRNLNTNEICGQGSYLWVVELTNKKGETELYSGTITLLK